MLQTQQQPILQQQQQRFGERHATIDNDKTEQSESESSRLFLRQSHGRYCFERKLHGGSFGESATSQCCDDDKANFFDTSSDNGCEFRALADYDYGDGNDGSLAVAAAAYTIFDLPLEILVHILLKLDLCGFAMARRVCTQWLEVADSRFCWLKRSKIKWRQICYLTAQSKLVTKEIFNSQLTHKYERRVRFLLETLDEVECHAQQRVLWHSHANCDAYFRLCDALRVQLKQTYSITASILNRSARLTVNFDMLDLCLRRYFQQVEAMFPIRVPMTPDERENQRLKSAADRSGLPNADSDSDSSRLQPSPPPPPSSLQRRAKLLSADAGDDDLESSDRVDDDIASYFAVDPHAHRAELLQTKLRRKVVQLSRSRQTLRTSSSSALPDVRLSSSKSSHEFNDDDDNDFDDEKRHSRRRDDAAVLRPSTSDPSVLYVALSRRREQTVAAAASPSSAPVVAAAASSSSSAASSSSVSSPSRLIPFTRQSSKRSHDLPMESSPFRRAFDPLALPPSPSSPLSPSVLSNSPLHGRSKSMRDLHEAPMHELPRRADDSSMSPARHCDRDDVVEWPSALIQDPLARRIWEQFVGADEHFTDFESFYDGVVLQLWPDAREHPTFERLFRFFVNFPADELMTAYKWDVIVSQFGPLPCFYANFVRHACGNGFLGAVNSIKAVEELRKRPGRYLLRFSRKETEKLTLSYCLMSRSAHRPQVFHRRKPCEQSIDEFLRAHLGNRSILPVEQRLDPAAADISRVDAFVRVEQYLIRGASLEEEPIAKKKKRATRFIGDEYLRPDFADDTDFSPTSSPSHDGLLIANSLR
jgi:F-box-like